MRPLGLSLYRAITSLLTPLVPAWLRHRARVEKEYPARLSERFGEAMLPRPPGRLVWLHGASVGEVEIALNLIQALKKTHDDLQFLLTSGTCTSAALADKRLDENAVHQYLPLDTPRAVQKFMAHWRPDLGVLIESELWPNLILQAKEQGTKLALVNARMNAQSFTRWQNAPASARYLLNAFDWIGAADEVTAQGLKSLLGSEVQTSGNLKLAAPAPMADMDLVDRLKRRLAKRPVWLALSTHEGEDEIILAAHKQVLQSHPDALLILVPRHPDRADKVTRLCKAFGLSQLLHSQNGIPDTNSKIYIGDSIGDMGLWLRLGGPAFIGGSLLSSLNGHNPLEAAKLGVAILTGPYSASFTDLYAQLLHEKGAIIVPRAEDIANAILGIWGQPARGITMSTIAHAIAEKNAGAPMHKTITALRSLLGEDGHARP